MGLNDYDCGQCTEVMKKMKGCISEDTAIESSISIHGKRVWRCPQALYNEYPENDRRLISKLFMAYFFLQNGILPKTGGFEDQNPFIMSCMPIIHRFVNQESENKAKVRAAATKETN